MLLRDRFWLWGHPEGCFNHKVGNELESRMTPAEACAYLGVRNVFMVPMGHKVNRRQYNKSFKALNGVGWDCFDAVVHPEKIETVIEEAKEFPNVICGVFDDFKNNDDPGMPPRYKRFDFETLKKVISRMHDNGVRRLDTWMVLYTRLFGIDKKDDEDFQPYMDAFDGVIMWVWKESDTVYIPEKFEIFKKLTPKNRRMFGCYLYNFCDGKQASGDAVKYQLDFYREKILSGEAEGVVLHTNTMADLDYEAYDVACRWMDEHGDETV
ncbi:MAG: hypothetical protein IJV00_01480 [Clostridia bacterium]|nr:hypothetical protein [Clostridia bacterium]